LREAAKRVGISYPRLDEFEKGIDGHTGKPTRPKYMLVLAMAKVYELPPSDLLGQAGYDLPVVLGDAEFVLLQGFRDLSSDRRQQVLDLITTLSTQGHNETF
jgi:transcriptional regulator with XRE-family HTH domain